MTKKVIKKEIKKRCKVCRVGSCCQDGVEVDLKEAMKISGLKLPVKKPWFEGLQEDKDVPSGWTMSTVVRDNRCVFQMKNKRCRVYSVRPKYCKDFPFEQNTMAEFYNYLCKEANHFKREAKKYFKGLTE